MSMPRANFTATLLRDGRVLIAGGTSVLVLSTESAATASTELYNPVTQSFMPGGPMSLPREGHTATLLADGRVLVVGGHPDVAEPAYASAEVYDPLANRWSSVAPMHHARTWQAAVLIAGGKVLVVGGTAADPMGIVPNGATAASLPPELYDPGRNTWTDLAMPKYDRPIEPTATLLRDGRVLVVGGQRMWQSPDVGAERSEIYDPKRNEWSSAPPENWGAARQFHTATLLNDGTVLVAGGLQEDAASTPGGAFHPGRETSIYDPVRNSWSDGPDLGVARSGQAAVQLADGRVLVAGAGTGWEIPVAYSNTAEEYDPATRQFYAVAHLTLAQGLAAMVELHDGSVLMVGGLAATGKPTPLANLFLPSGTTL